jgi:iron complex transport system ATP-binding protein
MNDLTELNANNVSYAYKGHPVLCGVSLSVKQGELVSLLGKNGAGKTTLLKLLQGFLKPEQGHVSLNNQPLARFSRRELATLIAYVPQSHIPPFPYLVEEVVTLGRIPHSGIFRSPIQEDKDAAHAAMTQLRINHLSRRAYTELSGGERQLVLIARALAQGARIFIMDEPITGLDYGNQFRLLDTLQELVAAGFGILMTTHHPEHALRASTQVALLIDGKIEQSGIPASIITPATIRHLYDVTVDAVNAAGHTLFVPTGV